MNSMHPYLAKISTLLYVSLCFGPGCGKKSDSKDSSLGRGNFLDLDFSGDTFTPHEAQTITLALIRQPNLQNIQDTQKRLELKSQVVTAGRFNFNLKAILEPSQSFFLDYYADVNGNGQCDPPPTDHVWRVEIDTLATQANTSIVVKEDHHMNFLGTCQNFSVDEPSQGGPKTQTIVGKLTLDTSINKNGFEPGQILSQGQVFLEGYPDQATRSDPSGQFVLKIAISPSLAAGMTGTTITGQKARLFMWYSQKTSENQSKSWTLSDLKFGAAKELTLDGSSIDLGNQSLTYTKGIKLKTIDSVSKNFVSNCWIYSPSFNTKLPFTTEPQGFHRIDYLPEGTYPFEILCTGYQKASTLISVTKASTAEDPWESPPAVELKPLTP